MAIYEENPIGTALGQVPNQIMQALQYKQAKGMQDQEMQMNKQAMEQARLQLAAQKKQLGMDRGGFGNKALDDYFMKLTLAPVSLTSGAGGNFIWSDSSILPTQAEAWQQYQNFVGPANITEADSRYFMNELWPNLINTRSGNVIGELDNLSESGYSPRDLRFVIMNNPALRQNLGLVLKHLKKDPKNAAMYTKYAQMMPQKPISMGERVSELAPKIGTAGLAAGYGYQWAQGTSAEGIKEAQEFSNKFVKRASGKNPINVKARSSEKLTKIKKDLETAKKRKANTPKSVKAKATRLKNLTSKVTKEKSRITKIIDKANKLKFRKIAEKSRWSKAMKKLPKNKLLNLPVAAFAPTVLGAAGQELGGDPGAAIGRGVGGGLQATYGAAKGVSLVKHMAKALGRIGAKKAPKVLGMAAADVASPIGDIAGMAWGLGTGSAEMYQAYKDWKLANQTY